MITLFKVIPSEDKQLRYSWYCDKCEDTTIKQDIARGQFVAEDSWPVHTPPSKRCPQCGNRASFISANIVSFWVRPDTGEELFKITDHPGACYHDERALMQSKDQRRGPDGQYLTLILPNNTRLHLDARSSACSRRSDNVHQCRVRTGSIEDGTLSLSKDGDTCGGVSEYISSEGIFYQLINNQLIEVESND